MPPRRKYYGPFVQLQANTYLDEAVRRVGPYGELLFVRSLQLAKFINKDGRISYGNLQSLSRGIYKFKHACDRLVTEHLWVDEPEVEGILIARWAKYNDTALDLEEVKVQAATRKQRSRARAKAEPAVDVSHVTVTNDYRKDNTETRPPSGSGRVSGPAAAPRGTGGATQHPAITVLRSELHQRAIERRAKLNKTPTAGNGRAEHVDFAATMAKLNEAAERLNGAKPDDAE